MRSLLFAFMLCCLASAPAFGAGSAQPPVRIVLSQEQPVNSQVFAAMKDELARQLAPAHLEISWYFPGEGDIYPHLGRTIQVSIAGSCKIDAAPVDSHRPAPYAETAVADGTILPFSTLDCPQISKALRRVLWGAQFRAADTYLGVAIGRVLAHEVYHILGMTHQHGARGVAKAALTAEELVAEGFALAGDAVARLQARGPSN